MGILYDRIVALCNRDGIKPGRMCTDTGISRGNVSDLKAGRITSLSPKNLERVAEYFEVSVDYLLGRTDDQIDYDQDGDFIASIPLSYIEGCGGDIKKAAAVMRAAEEDAKNEKILNYPSKSTLSDRELKIAMFGGDGEISDAGWAEVKRFAKYIKDKEQNEGETP